MPVNIVIIYNRAANGSDKSLLSSRCNIHFIDIFVCINYRRHNITCLAAGIYYNIPLSFMQKYHTLCIEQRSRLTLHSTFRFHWIKSLLYAQLHIVVCVEIKNKCLCICAHKLSFIFPIIQFNCCLYERSRYVRTQTYLVLPCTLSTFDNIFNLIAKSHSVSKLYL